MEVEVKVALEQEFAVLGNGNPKIENTKKVYGGSINRSFKVQTAKQNYFVKVNSHFRFPEMFAKEARGLDLLRSAHAIKIPEFLNQGTVGDEAYLILEFIESNSEEANFWENFGRQLAKLHQQS
ncbi:MAG: fructosamine kinase family protein, partial [Vicingaceae bacterium]